MISLRFPVPVESTPIPIKTKPKPFISQTQTSTRTSQSSLVPSLSLQRPTTRLLAATTDVSLRGEDEGLNDGKDLAGKVEPLPESLNPDLMPKHVAVIMDGNVRWARQRGLPSGAGHEAGVRSLRRLVELCGQWGIKVLTVFAFSADNWVRPKVEVEFLMSLFERGIKSELENFKREDIRISVIGDSSKLPDSLQKLISDAEESTKNNTLLQLIVAVSYSGKYDVIQACQSIAQKAKDGIIEVQDINEAIIEQELETNCTEFPYPDLLIRTSGELRVSNFLLWQLAYTELFFVQSLWPDFGKSEFVEALASFQKRQRRYGGRDK